ncbi:ubiquinone biosynthesis protein COQ9, mitochondrial-like isoform X2 [Homalodisca vitripennis]|uniref:ubiquinone biosynthesis protein COQ9, mitochondrial-like isoform X2 n=1 Tax=Homalodisca vitripennis TaxID=197043 RepID=UPI001EEA37E8|nr:ubiquinone biosynthesis protein COQ9, mitochondrial-like isoform X2 [Homalodisca vitripennis]
MAVCFCKGVANRIVTSYLVKGTRGVLVVRSQTTDVTAGLTVTGESTDRQQERERERSEENHQYEDNIKQKILQASLPFVIQYGWSKNAISAGASTLGYPGVIHGMFPQGGADLVNHFYATCNQELATQLKLAAESTDKTSTKEPQVFVRDAVETRLRMITPYLAQWPQALALMTLPPNVPTALANLLTLVDDICYYAGDRSVDLNWYSRRVALAAIYKMTELYMLQDSSEGHVATWEFLTRRVDEAAQLHSVLLQSETGVAFAQELASATFTTARNILGLQR